MSTFSFGGIATGLDTGAIIAQLLAIKRQPIVRLEQRKSLFEKQLTALSDLEGKLKALQEAMAALDTPNEFGSLAATSSNEDLLTTTASSLAAPGSYQIIVNSLATHQKDVSQGYASLTDNVGTGSLSITVAGETTQIDLTAPINSLTDLRDAINDAGAGVNATILNDGSDGTPYRLILTSSESGVDAAFSADLSGLSGGTAPVLSNLSTAADASLLIDSLPVVSASNTVTGAIEGLTLNLLDADPNAGITVNIATDDEAILEKIQTMVDAYNDLFSYIDSQAAEEGTLRGHSTLRTISSRLKTLFALPMSGGEGSLTLFAQVGISQDRYGSLNFDQTKFSEALAENYADVRDLFVERGSNLGKAYLIHTSIDDMTDPVDGLFKISRDVLSDRMENIDDTIVRYERSVDTYEVYLQRKFTAMENMVSALQAQGSYLASALAGLYM
jgi:flagellar hook-associated protein 2